MRKLLDI